MAQQHTEYSLLTRYLLPPSSLPTILPYKEFTTLHKPSRDPDTARALKRLYQDLQFQRNIDIDTVRLNIDRECTRGHVQRAKLRKKLKGELSGYADSKKRKRHDDDDDVYVSESEVGIGTQGYDTFHDSKELAIDADFFGPRGAVLSSTVRRYHTTPSLLEAMQHSIEDLKKGIERLDKESDQAMSEIQETVGGLSDLRYGKFSRVSGAGDQGEDGAVEAEVVAALRELRHAAERKSRQMEKGKSNG